MIIFVHSYISIYRKENMEEKKHWIFRWMCRCIIVNVIINGVGVLTGFITKEMIIPIVIISSVVALLDNLKRK